MLSDKKRLEIANICYAYVAGNFAMFINPINRGANFTWDSFVIMQEKSSSEWMFIQHVKGEKEEVNTMAKQYANEIATTLVTRAGLLK